MRRGTDLEAEGRRRQSRRGILAGNAFFMVALASLCNVVVFTRISWGIKEWCTDFVSTTAATCPTAVGASAAFSGGAVEAAVFRVDTVIDRMVRTNVSARTLEPVQIPVDTLATRGQVWFNVTRRDAAETALGSSMTVFVNLSAGAGDVLCPLARVPANGTVACEFSTALAAFRQARCIPDRVKAEREKAALVLGAASTMGLGCVALFLLVAFINDRIARLQGPVSNSKGSFVAEKHAAGRCVFVLAFANATTVSRRRHSWSASLVV